MWRPSIGDFFILKSSTGQASETHWGLKGIFRSARQSNFFEQGAGIRDKWKSGNRSLSPLLSLLEMFRPISSFLIP